MCCSGSSANDLGDAVGIATVVDESRETTHSCGVNDSIVVKTEEIAAAHPELLVLTLAVIGDVLPDDLSDVSGCEDKV